jgi:hypothetical protein
MTNNDKHSVIVTGTPCPLLKPGYNSCSDNLTYNVSHDLSTLSSLFGAEWLCPKCTNAKFTHDHEKNSLRFFIQVSSPNSLIVENTANSLVPKVTFLFLMSANDRFIFNKKLIELLGSIFPKTARILLFGWMKLDLPTPVPNPPSQGLFTRPISQ